MSILSFVLQSNTYQGVLITDGEVSYTIFIYQCGLLENGAIGAVGYYINGTHFQEHSLSNTALSAMVACQNVNNSVWSTVMFRLNGTGCNDFMYLYFKHLFYIVHIHTFRHLSNQL